MVHRALAAAERLADGGIEVEVVDLRTLYPLDLDTVCTSARRIRRVLVCHEAPLLYGFGAELAARLQQELWGEQDAPIRRLGGARTPIPYAAELEAAVVPSADDIVTGITRLCERKEDVGWAR